MDKKYTLNWRRVTSLPEEKERINLNERKIGMEIGEKRDEEVSKLFDPLIWFRISYIYTKLLWSINIA